VSAHSPDIAKGLDDIADLLELDDADPFRVRAYRDAARVVRGLAAEVAVMLKCCGACRFSRCYGHVE